MLDLTLEDIREYTGQQGRKIGQEYVFMCPACFDEKGKDNLHFNEKKGILWCFANEQHNKDILSEIMKKKYEAKRMENKEIPAYIKNQEQYLYYMELCNSALLGTLTKDWIDEINSKNMFEQNEYEFYLDLIKSDKPEKARTYLKQQRGINTPTIELTGLGFDFKARKWVIPIFNMNCEIVGFEYRLADFKNKKIWREKGTPSCLARVWGNGRKAIAQEGFMDSFCTVQMLQKKGILDNYSIFSTSAGVSALSKVINQLQFNKYDSITLILDTDEAADKVTKEIISKYSFIKDGRQFLFDSGCKDVNQFMLNIK